MKLFYVIILFSMVYACSEQEGKIRPTESSLTESVYSSVTIQPDSLYQSYAIVFNLVKEAIWALKTITFFNYKQ